MTTLGIKAATLGVIMAALAQQATMAQAVASGKGEWTGGVVGAASAPSAYCAIERRFDNGLTLSVAEDRRGDATLALLLRGQHDIDPAQTWPVQLMIGGAQRVVEAKIVDLDTTRAANAAAGDGQDVLIAMPVGDARSLASNIKTGRELTIGGSFGKARLSTDGLADGLELLARCAQQLGS